MEKILLTVQEQLSDNKTTNDYIRTLKKENIICMHEYNRIPFFLYSNFLIFYSSLTVSTLSDILKLFPKNYLEDYDTIFFHSCIASIGDRLLFDILNEDQYVLLKEFIDYDEFVKNSNLCYVNFEKNDFNFYVHLDKK